MKMPSKPHRGFSLTEVLVAVVVLSVGLLGLAGLQMTSLRNNHSAYLRTVATVLSYDMADRMRANRAAAEAGGYDNPVATEHPDCMTATGCSPEDMAEHDAFEWRQAIASQLPGGEGAVCLDGTPEDGDPDAPTCDGNGLLYAIKIWWDDERDGTLKRFVTSLRP